MSTVNPATIPQNIALHSHRNCPNLYRSATVFTQYPDTNAFLGVPFDARRVNIRETEPHRWLDLGFNHESHPTDNRYRYSYLCGVHQHSHVAFTRRPQDVAPSWVRNLLTDRLAPMQETIWRNAGLTGHLTYLLALVAFSCPQQHVQATLLNCIRLREWIYHNGPPGRESLFPWSRNPSPNYGVGTQYRGMVITVWYDFAGTARRQELLNLEYGVYGAFFNP